MALRTFYLWVKVFHPLTGFKHAAFGNLTLQVWIPYIHFVQYTLLRKYTFTLFSAIANAALRPPAFAGTTVGFGGWIPVVIPYRRRPVSRQRENPSVYIYFEIICYEVKYLVSPVRISGTCGLLRKGEYDQSSFLSPSLFALKKVLYYG
jgi:hypothetical protein